MSSTPAPLPPRPPNRRRNSAPPGPILIERRKNSQLQPVPPVLTWLWVGALVVAIGGAAALAWLVFARRGPLTTPRHRAEAIAFALTQPPAFTPPMSVESTAARVEGHYPANTTVAIALQSAMGFTDEMVAEQSHQRVGDFDVTSMWLRLPEAGGSAHWLVLGWIEDSDLMVCSFRFGGRGPVIGEEKRFWGEWLMQRVLREPNFQAGSLPEVPVRLEKGRTMPRFGPPER